MDINVKAKTVQIALGEGIIFQKVILTIMKKKLLRSHMMLWFIRLELDLCPPLSICPAYHHKICIFLRQ